MNDDRYILEELQRAILETEAEIARDICESYHPMRSAFLSWSADLDNGDNLPDHIGQVEAVRIVPYSGASLPDSYIVGESTSRENIKAWRLNTNNMFDAANHNASGSALSGYYNITNGTITFTGHAANVNICIHVPNYTTPALQIDNIFDNAIVAGTIPKLNKIGVPQGLAASYGAVYDRQRQAIRQGNMTMPEIPAAQAAS